MAELDGIIIPEKGFTHGGKFHSDDVFATALLQILNPNIQITRGFQVPEEFDGIVYDIGRGKFDHHQLDKEYRENGIPYAAFGLVWRAFGATLLGEAEAARFDESFIQGLDESDNTGSDHILAKVIAQFNPGWDTKEDTEEAFWKAVSFAKTILENHIRSVEGILRARDLVEESMKNSDGEILILSQYAPWKNVVIGSGYLFAVYPSNRGGYSIQGVPVSSEDNTLLCPFPELWRGKEPEELVQITGIPTLRFCHPSGFLAACDTKEDAVEVAKQAIELNK